MVPINWRDMETEELGSVYESLLELPQPRIDAVLLRLLFATERGIEQQGQCQRKTTGSYYTPDCLVQALLDNALDPVLDQCGAEARKNPPEALLSTGHHRPRLRLRPLPPRRCSPHRHPPGPPVATEGIATAVDYRHALRDVIRACIYGVDRNPMAVELTQVALWIETVEPGRPLGFLDAKILLR